MLAHALEFVGTAAAQSFRFVGRVQEAARALPGGGEVPPRRPALSRGAQSRGPPTMARVPREGRCWRRARSAGAQYGGAG
jgi:hypothetical protein